MWLSPEEARSDFILTVAAVLLGGIMVGLIETFPIIRFYPSGGVPFLVLSGLWLAVLGIVPPWWLARYRGGMAAAFGVGPEDRGTVVPGLVVAAPLLVGHLVPLVFTGSPTTVVRGLAGDLIGGAPSIAAGFGADTVYRLVAIPILALGSWLFGAFLVTRGRDAFRSPDADLTELVRTFGIGGAAAAMVLGLLTAVRAPGFLGEAVLIGVVLLVVVLLTDQYVPARITTTRASLVAPMIAVLIMWLQRTGGLFRGDLLVGLYAGAIAAVVVLCAGALILARRGLAGAILLAAAAVYPVGGFPFHATGLTFLIP